MTNNNMKGLEKYPTKVLVAWGEAISGKKEFMNVLSDMNFKELVVFCHALKNDSKSRKWLMDKGYPHLMALIHGAEGSEDALKWLETHGFTILKHMAMAIDGDKFSMQYFIQNHKVLAVLTQRMKFVKDRIEDDNQDPHKISF